MPPPVVYVVAAVVTTVAAAIAFKEFVYEPHIAPKLEAWAAQFVASRQAKRRQSQDKAKVPLTSTAPSLAAGSVSRQRTGTISAPVLGDDHLNESSYELEKMVAKELEDWRREVAGASSTTRHRHRHASSSTAQSMRESSIGTPSSAPFVIGSPETPKLALSAHQSRVHSLSPSTRRSSTTASTIPPSDVLMRDTRRSNNPSIASLELTRADSDVDRDAVMSVPSRPDSPFSAISAPRSPSAALAEHPTLPHVERLVLSDGELEELSIASSASVVDDNIRDDVSEWSWASGARSR